MPRLGGFCPRAASNGVVVQSVEKRRLSSKFAWRQYCVALFPKAFVNVCPRNGWAAAVRLHTLELHVHNTMIATRTRRAREGVLLLE